jgi:PASTA domain
VNRRQDTANPRDGRGDHHDEAVRVKGNPRAGWPRRRAGLVLASLVLVMTGVWLGSGTAHASSELDITLTPNPDTPGSPATPGGPATPGATVSFDARNPALTAQPAPVTCMVTWDGQALTAPKSCTVEPGVLSGQFSVPLDADPGPHTVEICQPGCGFVAAANIRIWAGFADLEVITPSTTIVLVPVPSVIGDRLDTAQSKIEAAGLVLGVVSGDQNGRVSKQDPAPPAKVEPGSPVSVKLVAAPTSSTSSPSHSRPSSSDTPTSASPSPRETRTSAPAGPTPGNTQAAPPTSPVTYSPSLTGIGLLLLLLAGLAVLILRRATSSRRSPPPPDSRRFPPPPEPTVHAVPRPSAPSARLDETGESPPPAVGVRTHLDPGTVHVSEAQR